jgi:exopolyphosphatase/guanosine-5'-triphosphate,3'-diphosphate pyrophosphatase
MYKRICAIDIGSNAMRAVLAKEINNELYCFKNYRFPIRLGADVFKNGRISSKRINLTEQAFGELFLKLSKHNIDYVKACATSALRDSINGEELIARIYKQTGIQIEIINGLKEAELIKNAIACVYNLNAKKALMIDIGGGSTEVTITSGNHILASRSYQFGTVRILESLKSKSSHKEIMDFCDNVSKFISQHTKKIDICFGTGGNLRRMGKLRDQLLNRPSSSVSSYELEHIISSVKPLSNKARIKKFSMRPDRVDVIVPAMEMIYYLLCYCNIEKIHLPKLGLKEGILLNSFIPRPNKIHLQTKDQ